MDRYVRPFTVRWADCDANGHMRNTAYSEYTIEVRLAFLAERGFGFDRFQALRFGPVLLREEIDYMHEVRLGEEVTVDLAASGLSPDGARFKFRHEIRTARGKLAARVVISGGWLDGERRRLMIPPDELRRAMEEMPRGEPFEELPPLKR